MTAEAGPRGIASRWLGLWRARPAIYSRRAWLALLLLDPLPWPWGERALSAVFVAKAFARPVRLRRVLAWAEAQPLGRGRRWRLALACHAHHGRVLARQALLGLRSPDALRRRVVIEGEQHLAAASTGRILLGFHLGAPGTAVALRTAGHGVTWMGGWRASPQWLSPAWQRMHRPEDVELETSKRSTPPLRGGVLYAAREHLANRSILYATGDGRSGRLAFSVPLPGRAAEIRTGWFALRRHCRVPVLPVLSRFEGLTQVITVHPPLPAVDPDPTRDLEMCAAVLAPLLADYVDRYPEQCYFLTFYSTSPAISRA